MAALGLFDRFWGEKTVKMELADAFCEKMGDDFRWCRGARRFYATLQVELVSLSASYFVFGGGLWCVKSVLCFFGGRYGSRSSTAKGF